MRRAVVISVFILLAIFSASAQAKQNIKILKQECFKRSIAANHDDGAIIETDIGHIYEIDDYDRFDSQLWLAGDSMLVCDITGLVNGQKIKVYTLRDLDSSGDDPDGAWASKLK